MIVRYDKYIFNLKKLIYRNAFNLILLLTVTAIGFIVLASLGVYKPVKITLHSYSENLMNAVEKRTIISNTTISGQRNVHCSYYTCFNAYRCGKQGDQQIQIYVYPMRYYVNEKQEPIIRALSGEFHTILKTIKRSKYYTSNAEDACIFVPPFDTLSSDNFHPHELNQALITLPYWRNGENHVIFNFLPSKDSIVINLATENAMIAAAGFDSWTYRPTFDVSLPAFVPLNNYSIVHTNRDWLIVVSQLNTPNIFKKTLIRMASETSDLVILEKCAQTDLSFRCYKNERYEYPHVLQKAVFCIVFRGNRLAQPALLEAIASGCVPVMLSDTLVMPFREVIDWKRAALFVAEQNLYTVVDVCKSVSESRTQEMSNQGLWLYARYFSSVEAVTNTTLDILNQRVFPEKALFYEDWNMRPSFMAARTPFILRTKSHSQGFTAVVLTYDRVESLFVLIKKLSLVPSLSMILVVWNNQRKSPPESEKWPKVNKPVKLIRTNENKLSNRFLPYKEIETDAVLSLDDDISMLTDDELDFGFEVWKEFPDRIVGFPSRNHVWDNASLSWKYESEWTNEISMILTGAAFYHKYWHYLYSTSMPAAIREWVDTRMNCEDIAMNFLVANFTNKAPIKVAPRKKFKCPECTNTEMLSADLSHMKERSACINKFREIYGHMPLSKIEFRADPVLYKDSFPTKLKRFKNIGNL